MNETNRNAERHVCTADDPWTADKGDSAEHPDAVCVYDGGWEQAYERYECPNCKLSFKVTLPDA